jgi:peptidoglycan/xylan/chitin deacetylase (PgdA/CDA1 family)
MFYRVRKRLRRFVRPVEASLYPRLFAEKSCLAVVLLHSVFRDRKEILAEHADPLEYTTVESLRRFIEYFLKHGYTFVSPEDVLAGLAPGQRYLLLTFDDGYANFQRVVPLLEEYDIYATLFAVSRNIQENRGFWWDVLYRNRRKQGVPPQQCSEESGKVQILWPEEIDRYMTARFGPKAFEPSGDADRPLTPDELKSLSEHPRVTIGNHTAEHANLLACDEQAVERQVLEAQRAIEEMTGKAPTTISYPFGYVSPDVMRQCGRLGLSLGITTAGQFHRIPDDLSEDRLMGLGRFTPSFCDERQCQGEAIRRKVLVSQVHGNLFHSRAAAW